MEFVKESVSHNIGNFEEWMNMYIDPSSKLYKQFELMLPQIPYFTETGGINILSPYFLWIEMLGSPHITVEKLESNNSCCNLGKKNHRYNVLYDDDEIIAVIDKVKVGNKYEYRYVSIPYKCLQSLLREYVEQLC